MAYKTQRYGSLELGWTGSCTWELSTLGDEVYRAMSAMDGLDQKKAAVLIVEVRVIEHLAKSHARHSSHQERTAQE